MKSISEQAKEKNVSPGTLIGKTLTQLKNLGYDVPDVGEYFIYEIEPLSKLGYGFGVFLPEDSTVVEIT